MTKGGRCVGDRHDDDSDGQHQPSDLTPHDRITAADAQCEAGQAEQDDGGEPYRREGLYQSARRRRQLLERICQAETRAFNLEVVRSEQEPDQAQQRDRTGTEHRQRREAGSPLGNSSGKNIPICGVRRPPQRAREHTGDLTMRRGHAPTRDGGEMRAVAARYAPARMPAGPTAPTPKSSTRKARSVASVHRGAILARQMASANAKTNPNMPIKNGIATMATAAVWDMIRLYSATASCRSARCASSPLAIVTPMTAA